jgi:hypothetical protein
MANPIVANQNYSATRDALIRTNEGFSTNVPGRGIKAIKSCTALLLIAFAFATFNAAYAAASTEPQQETNSQLMLRKLMEDIRHCDKTVRYEYDAKTRQVNLSALREIKGLRLKKLYREIAVFQIDETYEGMHATVLSIGRPNAGNRWPIHSVAFTGNFPDVRHRLESLWDVRFEDMLRPGPDVIYEGLYAQVQMTVDKKWRILAIEKMPLTVYPHITQPAVGCNHVEN